MTLSVFLFILMANCRVKDSTYERGMVSSPQLLLLSCIYSYIAMVSDFAEYFFLHIKVTRGLET